MTPDNRSIWIQKYLDGKLNASELEAFERQLLTDPRLQTEIQEYKKVALLVKEHKLIDIKKMASVAHANREKALFRKKVSIATAILLVTMAVGIAVWYMYPATKTGSEQTAPPSKTVTIGPNVPASGPSSSIDKLMEKKQQSISSPKQMQTQAPPLPTKDSVPAQKAIVQTTASLTSESETYPIKQSVPKNINTNKTHLYDCSSITLTASFDIQASCSNESSGSISYSNVQGGRSPYAAQLYDSHKTPLALWSELPAGQYGVMLSDAEHCSTWQQLVVAEKVCNSHHVFNPYLNETWEIPSKGKKGQLKIVDKKGNLYFSRNLIPSEIAFWDGKSNNGEIKIGYYLFYVQHEDNTLTSGSVTIIE